MLPRPDNHDTLNYAEGTNEDIRTTIEKNFPRAVQQTRSFAQKFRGNSAESTAHNIWKFLKTHCTYKKDEPEAQCVKLPSRFIYEHGFSDCKSYALTAASLLANNGLPVKFRYANYTGGSIPSHVYTVTQDENGNEIIVDGVWKYFNAEKKPFYKFDKPMNVYTLSGPGVDATDTSEAARFARFVLRASGKHNLQLDRMKTANPNRYAAIMAKLKNRWEFLKRRKRLHGKLYSGSLSEIMSGIENDYQDMGSFFSFIKKVALAPIKFGIKAGKKLGLAPARRAFRTLVSINMFGLAKKLYNVNKNAPKALEKKWKSLGGSYSALLKSTKKGYNHWAKKHHKQPMTGIYGCDLPILYNEAVSMGLCGTDEGIGAAPIAALLALAGTIITALSGLFKKHGGSKEVAEGKEASTERILEAAADGVQAFNERNTAGGSGLSMEDPTDPENAGQFDLQVGKEDTPDNETSFTAGMPLILGGVALLALLGMKKSKN